MSTTQTLTNIAVEGSVAAGKSTLIGQFNKLLQEDATLSRFNFVEANLMNTKMMTFGGRMGMRVSAHVLQQQLAAGILTIDGSNLKTAKADASKHLEFVRTCARMNIPLLVLVNKKDLDHVATDVVVDTLELKFSSYQEHHIQHCSALTGEDLKDGLVWLDGVVKERADPVAQQKKHDARRAQLLATRQQLQATRDAEAAAKAAKAADTTNDKASEVNLNTKTEDVIEKISAAIGTGEINLSPSPVELQTPEKNKNKKQKTSNGAKSPSFFRRVVHAIF